MFCHITDFLQLFQISTGVLFSNHSFNLVLNLKHFLTYSFEGAQSEGLKPY